MRAKTVKNRYVILIVGMIMQLCAGIIYMWSVFKAPVSAHLSWTSPDPAITSSIMLATFVLGIIVGGRLQDKYAPFSIALTGSLFLGLGMILSSFVPSTMPWLIYLSYGVIGGFGVGCVYTVTVSVVQKWFPDKRGFATGMMVSAFGFSLVLFAPVTKLLLKNQGVPFTFLFFGIMFLVICSACSFFLSNPQVKAGAAAGSSQKQYTTSEMLKTKEFYMLALCMFFLLPAYFILNPLLMSLGMDRGLSENMATFGVMLTGIASASGRLLVSWLSDFAGRKAAMLLIAVITIAAAVLMIFAQGIVFLVCIAAIAFAFGGSASVYAATAADLFGTKHIGMNYGCVMVAFGVSALVFQLVSARLAATGSYTYSFVIAAATAAITLVISVLFKVPRKQV